MWNYSNPTHSVRLGQNPKPLKQRNHKSLGLLSGKHFDLKKFNRRNRK